MVHVGKEHAEEGAPSAALLVCVRLCVRMRVLVAFLKLKGSASLPRVDVCVQLCAALGRLPCVS